MNLFLYTILSVLVDQKGDAKLWRNSTSTSFFKGSRYHQVVHRKLLEVVSDCGGGDWNFNGVHLREFILMMQFRHYFWNFIYKQWNKLENQKQFINEYSTVYTWLIPFSQIEQVMLKFVNCFDFKDLILLFLLRSRSYRRSRHHASSKFFAACLGN